MHIIYKLEKLTTYRMLGSSSHSLILKLLLKKLVERHDKNKISKS